MVAVHLGIVLPFSGFLPRCGIPSLVFDLPCQEECPPSSSFEKPGCVEAIGPRLDVLFECAPIVDSPEKRSGLSFSCMMPLLLELNAFS